MDIYILRLKNTPKCNFRASIFQKFPGETCPKISMLIVLCTITEGPRPFEWPDRFFIACYGPPCEC